jgi:hypothetical protein
MLSRTDHVPERNSDVIVWHATHGLVPGVGAVTGVCANCQIEKMTLRMTAAYTRISTIPRPFSLERPNIPDVDSDWIFIVIVG